MLKKESRRPHHDILHAFASLPHELICCVIKSWTHLD